MQEGAEIARKDVLASLGSREFSNAQKAEAVAELKQLVLAAYEKKVAELTALAAKIAKLNDELERQHQILQDCEHHIHAYSQIPDYVGLRDEINREFAKRQLNTQACFACEYVISIKDEKWRDALESFLGRRRYTILVEPQYYDIADDVLNNSRYRYAHLFNTKLLLKKKVEVEQDSVLKQLEIKNEIAKKYFAYQLGRMHAVPLNEVRNYENAITKEGSVSVALDSYFLRFDKLRFYYLGQKTFELNRKRAEKMIRELTGERKELLAEQTQHYEDVFKNEFVLNIYKYCEAARSELREINTELAKLNFSAKYQFDVRYVKDGSDYERILAYAKYLDEQEQGGDAGGLNMFASAPAEDGLRLEQEMKLIINRIIAKNNEELIRRFADYRNYMTYEVLVSNSILDRAKLSRQTGFNSGAEVQIPYMLILLAALLLVYNQHVNSTRLVFIDEPFAKMDPGNVKLMLDFMKAQQLQVIFCSPDKTETIGNACEVVLPVLRVQADNMQLGIVKFHEEQAYGRSGCENYRN